MDLSGTAFYVEEGESMFDSLDEQIKMDDRRIPARERMMRWAIVGAAALIVCAAVIIGVHFMS